MATLESLIIEIKAQGENFARGISLIESRLKTFESTTVGSIARVEGSFGKLEKSLAIPQKLFAAFGAVAALGGLTSLVKGALETGDSLGDLSVKLGLSTDALQEYRFAAQLSGVSNEQFEGAVVKLNKSIAEAQDPTSKAAKLFAKLGVDVGEAGKTIAPTEVVLTTLLGKLNEIPSPAQRTKVAMDLMGKSAANMAILAGEGAEGIAKLRQQAHEMGLVLDAETIRKAGELNDKWDAMSQVIRAQLVPALTALAPWFLTIAESIGAAGVATAKYLDQLSDFIETAKLIPQLSKTSAVFSFANPFSEIAKGEGQFPIASGLIVTQLRTVSEEIVALQKKRDELAAKPEGLFDNVFGPPKEFQLGVIDAAIKDKFAQAQKLRDQFATLNPDTTARKPKPTPPEGAEAIDLPGGDDKAKKAPKGPDFTAIENRFLEEAARAQLQLQKQVAQITGDTAQFEIAALQEVAAHRQASIHQAQGDVVALQAIERSAQVERLQVQLESTNLFLKHEQDKIRQVETTAQRQIATTELQARSQRETAAISLENLRQEIEITGERGASIQDIVQLRQQEISAIQQAAQIDITESQRQITATRQLMAQVSERYEAEQQKIAELEAARAATADPLAKAVDTARIQALQDSLDQLAEKYLALASRVGEYTAEQLRAEQEVTQSARRIGEEIRRIQAPVSTRVFEKLAQEAQGSADRIADAWVRATNQMADGLAEFVTTGKGNFKDLIRSIETDLIKSINREIFQGWINKLLGIGQPGQQPGQPTTTTGSIFGNLINLISGQQPQQPVFQQTTLEQQVAQAGVPFLTAPAASPNPTSSAAATAAQPTGFSGFLSQIFGAGGTPPFVPQFPQAPFPPGSIPQFPNAGPGGQPGGLGQGLGGLLGQILGTSGGSTQAGANCCFSPQVFDPVVTTMQQTGQAVEQQVGNAGQQIVSNTGQTGQGILSQISQFAQQSISSINTLIQSLSGGGGGGGGGGGFLGILGGLFGGSGGGGGGGAAAAAGTTWTEGWTAGFNVPFFHEGTAAGTSPMVRMMDESIVAGAKRFHTGLMPDEFPAILQAGESVFSRGQTAALKNADTMLQQLDSQMSAGRDYYERQTGSMINAPITINTPDIGSFRRNESQVQAQVHRALDKANRRNN